VEERATHTLAHLPTGRANNKGTTPSVERERLMHEPGEQSRGGSSGG
jgi:hypothetical protein